MKTKTVKPVFTAKQRTKIECLKKKINEDHYVLEIPSDNADLLLLVTAIEENDAGQPRISATEFFAGYARKRALERSDKPLPHQA